MNNYTSLFMIKNMKKVVYSLLLMSSLTYAQLEKKVGEFSKVTSFDQIEVTLIESSESKVILDGSGAEEVEVVNKNGELKLRMPLTKLLSGDHVSATVYYTKIDAVETNEGSRIISENTIKSTSFFIIAKEGSSIHLQLEVSKLEAKIANGSKVHLSGTAKNQDIVINSGGIFEAQNLKTVQTNISLNAGGDATVFATELVDAKVRAGGEIIIYGKPLQINQKTIAGGRIIEAK
jgi:hypothetical protein